MTEETPLQKTLKEIMQTRNFDQLHPYSDSQLWVSMSLDERQALSELFLQAAEAEIKHQKSEEPLREETLLVAKKMFHTAVALTPSNPYIWYRRGCAYMGNDEPTFLEEASLCFEQAVTSDPGYFDAWYAWGSVLMHRASLSGELDYINQAKEKFLQAEAQMPASCDSKAQFFWHFGLVWFTIARTSGEAGDFHTAHQLLRKAFNFGLSRRDFFHDFGNILVALAMLINSQDMLIEAAQWYERSVDIQDNKWESDHEIATRYCNLGSCYKLIFEKSHDTSHYERAKNSYSTALHYRDSLFSAFLFSGILELFAAKLWQNVEHLESSVDMLKQASLQKGFEEHPLLLARWSEAQSLLGYHEESLEQLSKAQDLAKRVLELAPQKAESWFAIALVCYQFGRYFSDHAYFLQACEYAQKGLSQHPEDGQLWHILAVAKFSISETTPDTNTDLSLLEESLLCFHHAAKSDLCQMGCFWNDWGIVLLNIAELTQDPKLLQEALDKFEQAILRQEHTNLEWLVHYASGLDLLGDLTDDEESYERAAQILTHVVTNDPENLTATYQLALVWSHLAELASDLGAYQKAIAYLQKVVEEDPEDEDAWGDLGLAYIHVAELSADPNEAPVRKSLYELAEHHFLRALSLGNQFVYYHMACLYALQANFPDAVSFLEKALDNKLLPPLEDLMEDEWLEPLIHTSHFQHFKKRFAPEKQ